MKVEELKAFIHGTMNYFGQIDGTEATVGIPYPQSSDFLMLDYVGAIGISGGRKGCIYVTATTPMLNDLIKAMGQEADEAFRVDVIGEIANNISGSAQSSFVQDFMISIPMVITGKDLNVHLPLKLPVFIIPFQWKNHKAYLAVGIE
ncbi:MAG: chemotaxis protein CheX [Leptospira sp.]|nr:chemotaxis protein CheX [Leptospira sp.]